jgi:CheY-like chemotaxis protein
VFKSSPVNNAVSIAPGQTSYRILIAEDNAANRLLLGKILSQLGFEMQEAENGQVAIAICQQWRPHLIFMDMHMPIINGYEAARQIRNWEQTLEDGEFPTPTKIIALTASAFTEQRQESLDAGCDDFVSKPFRWQEILETLAKHLGVEYLYAETSGNAISPNSEAHKPKVLDAAALTIMPAAWITQLHFAAAQGNDTSSLNLIAQIPAEHSSLIAALTNLIETYNFDQLMDLTQPPLSEDI